MVGRAVGVLVIGTAVRFAAATKNKETEDDKEQDDSRVVAFDKLPTAARDALTKFAGDAKIGEATLDDEDGGGKGKEGKQTLCNFTLQFQVVAPLA